MSDGDRWTPEARADMMLDSAARELERWRLQLLATNAGGLEVYYRAKAVAAVKERDKHGKDKFGGGTEPEWPIGEQRLWYKFHGQFQGWDSAAKHAKANQAAYENEKLEVDLLIAATRAVT